MRLNQASTALFAFMLSALAASASSPGMKELKASADPAKDGKTEMRASLVTVSIEDQELKVFDGINEIARSRISSGKPGHDTPTGVFTILEKSRHHRSNIYSGAPMPYMQRLTWSGVALHESNSVPSYPASHGCVRMPGSFAKQIWTMTSRGETHVIIAPEPLTPHPIRHAKLFMPKPANADPMVAVNELRQSVTSGIADMPSLVTQEAATAIEAASVEAQPADEPPIVDTAPLRIYATRATIRDRIRSVQEMLTELGHYVDEIDGLYGRNTIAAMKAFQNANALNPTGSITDESLAKLYAASGRPLPPAGHLYVRRDHDTILDVGMEITDPHKPLGAHLMIFEDDGAAPGWIGVSMSQRIPESILREHEIETGDAKRVRAGLMTVLDRLVIPDEARASIERMLVPGSSFAISDNGLGTETGKGTDFIVQIH